jgi:hypothetical protein
MRKCLYGKRMEKRMEKEWKKELKDHGKILMEGVCK